MERREREAVRSPARIVLALVLATSAGACAREAISPVSGGPIAVSDLLQVAEVDARFLSYNIEMVQVTGGRFWAPYGGPSGERYRYRPPMDFSDRRLLGLAAHLSPSYIRVSGTWANSTYVALEGEHPSEPPPGFGQVLTQAQWTGLVGFARALNAPIVTSFAASEGTRDDRGQWTTTQADRLLFLTRKAGGRIHAAEFLNEPSLTRAGALPANYDSTAFGRDFAVFAAWAGQNAPDMLLLGPGNLGEETVDSGVAANMMAPGGAMATERLMAETAGQLDVVSWHFYGGVSPRCGGGAGLSSASSALSDDWLDRTLIEWEAVSSLRDRHAPGKPLWLTETAQAACGGSPWAVGLRDSFRHLNQLGQLARRGVRVVMHNTLNASEYGLIDAESMSPRANFWASLLWKRTMGQVVLGTADTRVDGLKVFAHCLPGSDGGVGLLVLNPRDANHRFAVAGEGQIWVMQASDLDSGPVSVNGAFPEVTDDGSISGLAGVSFQSDIDIPPHAVVFAALPDAGNARCRA